MRLEGFQTLASDPLDVSPSIRAPFTLSVVGPNSTGHLCGSRSCFFEAGGRAAESVSDHLQLHGACLWCAEGRLASGGQGEMSRDYDLQWRRSHLLWPGGACRARESSLLLLLLLLWLLYIYIYRERGLQLKHPTVHTASTLTRYIEFGRCSPGSTSGVPAIF